MFTSICTFLTHVHILQTVEKSISYVKRLCSGSALIKIDLYESQLIQKYISCDITSACNKRYSLFFQKKKKTHSQQDMISRRICTSVLPALRALNLNSQ